VSAYVARPPGLPSVVTVEVSAPAGDADARRAGSVAALLGLAALCIVADQAGAATGLSSTEGWRAAVVSRLDLGVAVIMVAVACRLYGAVVAGPARTERLQAMGLWRCRLIGWVLPLWIVVAVTFLVTERSESVADWIRHLTLVQTFSYFHIHASLSHLWPLTVLASFVLIVPILGRVATLGAADRSATTWRHLAVAALSVVVGLAFRIWHHDRGGSRPVLQWLDWLGLGMALAVLADPSRAAPVLRGLRTCAAAPGTCWSLAGLIWLLSTTRLASVPDFDRIVPWQQTTQHVLDGLAAFFIVLPVVAGPVRRRSARHESVNQLLGRVSYGIFLWQLPVLLVVQDRLGLHPFGGGFLRVWLLTTVGAVGCAWITRLVVQWTVRERSVPRTTRQPRRRTSPGSPVRPPA
jgi:peptidoglycan/LPS O-acetylase OafA/YrhL